MAWVLRLIETGADGQGHSIDVLEIGRPDGVVQTRVTPKTRNPFTLKALLISGVTWKWHFLNHAR